MDRYSFGVELFHLLLQAGLSRRTPATPPPPWCPGIEPSWDELTDEYGGGAVCTWSRNFPGDDPGADVSIQCEDRIVDGRVLRTEARIMLFEPSHEGLTPEQVRRLAAELLNAADELERHG